MNANNLTGALTTRLLDENGVERFSASIGQIRYFTPQRVKLPGQPDTDWTGSDYVAQASVQLNDQWRASSLLPVEPEHPPGRPGQLRKCSAVSRATASSISPTASAAHRAAPARCWNNTTPRRSIRYPSAGALLARWTYSVKDRRTVEALAGVAVRKLLRRRQRSRPPLCRSVQLSAPRARTPTTRSCSSCSSRAWARSMARPRTFCGVVFLAINNFSIV